MDAEVIFMTRAASALTNTVFANLLITYYLSLSVWRRSSNLLQDWILVQAVGAVVGAKAVSQVCL